MRPSSILLGAAGLLLASAVSGQTPDSGAAGARTVNVALEIRRGEAWQTIDPRTVLHSGDDIQFRFETSGPGFLYVFDISSGGHGSWLYPRAGQGGNHVEPGRTYRIPGRNGSFLVGGAAGYDVTYWIVSPTPMDIGASAEPPPVQPNTLRPRCGPALLKARGLCLDEHAGPGPVPDLKQVPLPQKQQSGNLVARDLTFHSQDDSTRIAAPDTQAGIIVYQFSIAHQ